jgi:hypothetical protein
VANVVDVAVGDPIFLTAQVDNLPAGGTVTWSNAVNISPDGSGLSAVAYFYQGGEYTITATGGLWLIEDGHATPPDPGSTNTQSFPTPGSASIVVRAYEVTAVTANPNPVPVGDPLTATATVIPGPPPASVPITWSHGSGNGVTTAINSLPLGWQTITATLGTSQASATVASVGVASFEFMDPDFPDFWQQSGQMIYPYQGDTLGFRAWPEPSDAPWPANNPKWEVGGVASGTGPQVSIPFAYSAGTSLPVVVKCGSSQKSTSALVWTISGTTTPEDNFQGRAQNLFGLEEPVTMKGVTTPSGLSFQLLSLSWAHGGQVYGRIEEISESERKVLAISEAGIFESTIRRGLRNRVLVPFSLPFIAPTDADYRPPTAPGVSQPSGWRVGPQPVHAQFRVGALQGFEIWIKPESVSWAWIQFWEGECTYTDTGFLATPGVTTTHQPWGPNTVSRGLPGLGCKVNNLDVSGPWDDSTPLMSPPLGGDWKRTAAIPLEYVVLDNFVPVTGRRKFGTASYEENININGDVQCVKKGNSWGATYGAPTLSY